MKTLSKDRVIHNKRARFDYEIIEDSEAGLVLTGEEVKAFRAGKANLSAAFVRPLYTGPSGQSEIWLINAYFSVVNEPDRSRKLLLARKDIDRLVGKIQEKGLTLLPLSMYFRRGNIKVSIGLGRGKKRFEKREALKRKDVDRELRREVKG